MSNSGSFSWTTSNDFLDAKIKWEVTSQDVANNTSTLNLKLYFYRTNSGYHTYRKWWGNLICGSEQSPASGKHLTLRLDITNGSETFAQEATLTVKHNADGSCNIAIGAVGSLIDDGMATYNVPQSLKTISLPIIGRNSTMSCGEFTIGTEGTISVAKENATFTHTITYLWGDTSSSGISSGKGYKGTICTKSSSTSVKWTPPFNLINVIPNDVHGVGTLLCDTYTSTGVFVGTSSVTFTANVPSTVIPSITSFVAERVSKDIPDSWGLYIQGKSQCKLTVVGAGAYNSTIKSCSIKRKLGGVIISSTSTGTTSVLNESGDVTFVASVTDSRGRTASKEVTIYVTPYSVPTATSILSQRSNAGGIVDDNGTYIRTSCNYTVASCGGKNSASCKIYYRKSGDTAWSSGVSYTSGSVVVLAGNADVDSSYEVKYEVSDALSTVTFIDVVSTSFTTFDLKKGGKGFAIGKASEKECFECAMDAEFTGAFSADLSKLIVMQSYTSGRLTVNSNATIDAYVDITKDGYTALGVVGVHTSHGSALLVVAHLESPTQAKVTVRNVGTASIVVAPSVDILYLKNI
jgi:hypothetical protein